MDIISIAREGTIRGMQRSVDWSSRRALLRGGVLLMDKDKQMENIASEDESEKTKKKSDW